MGMDDAKQLRCDFHPERDASSGNSKPVLVSQALNESYEAYTEMKSFRGLEDGWDGWDGDKLSVAPGVQTVNAALDFFDKLPDNVTKPNDACASCDGVIYWSWYDENGIRAHVSFRNNGEVGYALKNDKGRKGGIFKASDPVPNELLECLRTSFYAE